MIYLVRHGQTDWNKEKRIQGSVDIPLNENGCTQAKIIAEEIEKFKIDKIISSDLIRAKQTAQIINEKLNVNITYDKRLREINYGKLEGQLISDIPESLWRTFREKPEEIDAESMKNVHLRVKSLFDEVDIKNENTLIVTHGGALRTIFYYAENSEYDYEKYMKCTENLKIENLDIYKLEEELNNTKIYKVNI